MKFGLTSDALHSYVTLISAETRDFFARHPDFVGKSKGAMNVVRSMAELTIYTASRSLQGKEVRERFNSSFADLYHDLDMGFSPINFMLPWAPLPHNRKRDAAHKIMVDTYTDIIRARKASKPGEKEGGSEKELDMVWNLMACQYKDGRAVPDYEVAHMMIALLMAGQHSSSSTSSWVVLRLASRPDITEELLQEQKEILGEDLPPLTYDDLQRLPLHNQVVKETLRLHSPIHSMLRKVKSPMLVEGTPYVIPTTHVLLAAPGVTSRMDEHFPNAMTWEPHRWDEGSGGTNMPSAEEEEKIDYGYGLVTKGATSPYLPFGAGRHRCIGEQFAYVQLGTILATTVRLFKFQNLPGQEGVVGTDYSVGLRHIFSDQSADANSGVSHCSRGRLVLRLSNGRGGIFQRKHRADDPSCAGSSLGWCLIAFCTITSSRRSCGDTNNRLSWACSPEVVHSNPNISTLSCDT